MSGSGETNVDKTPSIHGLSTSPQGHVVELATAGFGTNADSYDACRPGYSDEAVKIIAEAVLSVSSIQNTNYQVLEMGAGTGKLTQQLIKTLPSTTKYLAIDPSKSFLDILNSKGFDVETVQGSADKIPLPDNSVPAVVCAQSFHWFSDLPSLRSIYRVLAPGGLLILLWNKKNSNEDWRKKIQEQMEEIIEKVGSSRRYALHEYEWQEDIEKSQLFKLIKRYDLPTVESSETIEKMLSTLSTTSVYNALPSSERVRYIEELRTMLKNWPGLDVNNLLIHTTTDLFIYCAEKESGTNSEGHVAELALDGFGHNASNYDAHRPGYTEEAVKLIAEAVDSVSNIGQNIRYQVLEMGAGTGKLTQQLVKELPKARVKYLALDPSKNFLDTLKAKQLGVEIIEASADNIPLPDHSVQAVVCAQSFHWFSEMPNLESIHRVLAPGGLLILIWNQKHFDEGWLQRVLKQRCEVMEKAGASKRYVFKSGEWRQDIERCRFFTLHKYYDLPGVDLSGPMEEILANLTTVSTYNILPPHKREEYLEELRTDLRNWPGLDLNHLKIRSTTDLYIYVAQEESSKNI